MKIPISLNVIVIWKHLIAAEDAKHQHHFKKLGMLYAKLTHLKYVQQIFCFNVEWCSILHWIFLLK